MCGTSGALIVVYDYGTHSGAEALTARISPQSTMHRTYLYHSSGGNLVKLTTRVSLGRLVFFEGSKKLCQRHSSRALGLVEAIGQTHDYIPREELMFACMRFGRWLSCIAAMAMMAAPLVAAEKAHQQASQQAHQKDKAGQVFDVKLSKQGTLVGQLLTANGAAIADSKLLITNKSKMTLEAKTDARGVFQLPVKKSGVYRLQLADQAIVVRAWDAGLAPPATRDSLLCVTQDGTVRGQAGATGFAALLTNPLFIGLGVAAAVAAPIIADEIDDDDEDSPSAS